MDAENGSKPSEHGHPVGWRGCRRDNANARFAPWQLAECMQNALGVLLCKLFPGRASDSARFANTNSYLLIGTFVVSVLHMIFEYLALKHDVPRGHHDGTMKAEELKLFVSKAPAQDAQDKVLFWQKTDAETLKRYVSLRAIFGEIFCISTCKAIPY